MKIRKLIFLIVFGCISSKNHAQNLPSLLLDKNINSTFSILAYDEDAQEWGIAVATDNIYVGNSTIYIQSGIGAFSVIAETEPKYGIKGLQSLEAGQPIEQAINAVRNKDNNSNYRQVSGIDAQGNVFAFTGQSLKYWQGHAAEILGNNYVVMGNQLAPDVLTSMSDTFKKSTGTLAERLLESLLAGQNAGGQISGKQSAAIVVKGVNNEWYNQIDLRVDNSKQPFKELQTLMNHHYGRIRLNQAMYAHRNGLAEKAKIKLAQAESMLDGWTGMYARIAVANTLIKNEDTATHWIKKGLKENKNWTVNLPAFYFLRNHPEMQSVIKPEKFTATDWESAIQLLSQLGKEAEIIELSKTLSNQNIESSYLSYLIGRSYYYEKNLKPAIEHLEKALLIDNENIEAEKLLKTINTD